MAKEMLTANEVAELLGVSVYTIHRERMKPDGLKSYKIAGCVRFFPEDVEDYLARQQVQPVVRQEPKSKKMKRFHYVPGMKVV